MIIKAGNIRKGMHILFKNQPSLVTKTDFMSPGKGSAFMRAKFKSLITGNTQEFTYKSNELVEEIEVSSIKMQYLYTDGQDVVFMNPSSYEQLEVPSKLIGKRIKLLTSDIEVYVIVYNDQPIGVSFSPKIKLKVVSAQDAVAGNTMGSARKEVELETGLKILVPIFIKEGDMVVIDTETMTYVSRT